MAFAGVPDAAAEDARRAAIAAATGQPPEPAVVPDAAPPPADTAVGAIGTQPSVSDLAAQAKAALVPPSEPTPAGAPAVPPTAAPSAPPAAPLVPPPAGAAGPALSQTTSSGKTSRSFVEPTKEERRLQEDSDKLEKDAIALEEKKRAQAVKVANQEALTANLKEAITREADTRKQVELMQIDDEIKRRQAIADRDDAAYRQELENFNNPKNTWWSRQDTGTKVRAGMSLLLGFLGGGSDGSNVGADRIIAATERDTAHKKQVLENRLKVLEMSKGDVRTAKEDTKRRLEMVDVRTVSALDAAAANAEARLRALGIDEPTIAANAGIQKIKAEALAKRQQFEQGLRVKVEKDSAWNKVTVAGGPAGAGAGGADTRLKPSSEDLAGINTGADALRKLDAAVGLIDKDPKAWGEYRSNNLDWKQKESLEKIPGVKQVRGAFQGVGLANVAPEQGLKSENAKDIHRAVTQLREQIAKGFGGVVTESDRQSADSLLALAAVSDAGAARRLLLQAKEKLTNGMRLTIANRQIAIPEGVLPTSQAPAGARAPAASGPPPGTPPGAQFGTSRGHKGWLWPDGSFHPTS